MTIRANAQKAIQEACDVVSELIRVERDINDAKHLIDNNVDEINTPRYDDIINKLNRAIDRLNRVGEKI